MAGISPCFFVFLQVAAIYRDSSIGNLVNIVVVKIIVIHNEHVRNGSKMSNVVCIGLL